MKRSNSSKSLIIGVSHLILDKEDQILHSILNSTSVLMPDLCNLSHLLHHSNIHLVILRHNLSWTTHRCHHHITHQFRRRPQQHTITKSRTFSKEGTHSHQEISHTKVITRDTRFTTKILMVLL